MTTPTPLSHYEAQARIAELEAVNAELLAACKIALATFELLAPSEPYEQIDPTSPHAIVTAAIARASKT